MKIHYCFTLFLLLFFLNGCLYDVGIEVTPAVKKAEIPFTYEIIKDSRQIVLTQEYPWESQALLFFNVLEKDSLWHMWYMGVGKEVYSDNFGAFCYAYSKDGALWNKKLLNQKENIETTNILMSSKNTPIVEQFVFFDEEINEYRMIGVSVNNGKTSTFIWKSVDGIHWSDKILLYNAYYDTQFSVIIRNNHYYIYQRFMHGNQRAVGRSVIDRNLNVIEPPKLMLLSSDEDFPHIYNNAASKLQDVTILFPTLYNENTDSIKMVIGYEDNNKLYLSEADITEDLYRNENIKWGIVSPGLISTDEPNTYWIYYYGTTFSHNTARIATNNNIAKYYRIKIKILLRK